MFVGEYMTNIAVNGFPWKFTIRIMDECDLMLLRALAAFRPSRIPTHGNNTLDAIHWFAFFP